MLLTDDEIRELGPLARTGPIFPINTHQTCLDLFCALFDELRASGWKQWHIDTYRLPDQPGWEIKHQYVAGTWEIHLTRIVTDVRRTVTIRRDRKLPTLAALLSELFGPDRDRLYAGTLLDPPTEKKAKKGSKTS